MSEEKKTLISKLIAVMAAVDSVEKDKENTSQHYKYVSATAVYRAIRNEFVKNKIFMTTNLVSGEKWEQPTRSGGTMNYSSIILEYTFHDGESSATLGPFRGPGWGSDTGDKAIYKALTGAMKYIARNTFLVPDDSDPENDTGEPGDTPSRTEAGKTSKSNRTKTETKPVENKTENPDDKLPTKEEMEAIRTKLKSYVGKEISLDDIKQFIFRTTGKNAVNLVTKKEFDGVLEKIRLAAEHEAGVAGLVKP